MILARLKAAIGSASIRTHLAVLIFVSQLFAVLLTFVIIMNVVVGEEQEGRLERDASDAFFALLLAIPAAEATSTHPGVVALVEADERFMLLDQIPQRPTVQAALELRFALELPTDWADRVQGITLERTEIIFGPELDAFALLARLADGKTLQFTPQPGFLLESFSSAASILRVLIVLIPLVLLTIWVSFFVIAPVDRLARGATRFARDAQAEPLDLSGPREVRSAMNAFNNMQAKLRALMDARAQTLAAIGHDIRTPLTRMRLRLEEADLGESRGRIEQDLSAMEVMINDALEFLEHEARSVDLVATNLTALCESVVDEFSDRGQSVTVLNQTRIDLICDVHLTQRAVQNVIENAVKYADGAEVLITPDTQADTVEIRVRDHGPGIPEGLMQTVLKPFNRVQTVREDQSTAPQGFGLGLAIALDCMERQGGSLSLGPNHPTGLTVSLRLSKNP